MSICNLLVSPLVESMLVLFSFLLSAWQLYKGRNTNEILNI